jgi:uncharacterized protein (TIGR02391 family)
MGDAKGISMAGLIDFLPDANALKALEPEDLGFVLLQLIQQGREPRFTLSDYEMPLWNANVPGYPHRERTPVGRALAEAWQWLQNDSLMMPDPEQSSGWFCLTRKGKSLRTPNDVGAYQHGRALPSGLLEPMLAEKVRPMFQRGDYDVAVLQAFKIVEVAVRSAAGLSEDLVGVKLMREAFKPDGGLLADKDTVLGERVAVMELYAGAMGHCKNPSSHRDVRIERSEGAQLILFASYLLARLKKSTSELG